MKFKVFTGREKEAEREVYFRLLDCGGYITLVACDRDGNVLPYGYILNIKPGGGISRCVDVSREIDLLFDADGFVKIV